jgi:hypothetical protein
MSCFRLGLYYWHPSWKPLLIRIMIQLLKNAIVEDESTNARAIAALQLLPGMMELCRRRKDKLTPINFLRAILASPNVSVYIIKSAVDWRTKYGDNAGVLQKEMSIELLR